MTASLISAQLASYLQQEACLVRSFRHGCTSFCPLHAHDTCEIILHLGGSGWEWMAGGQPQAFSSGGITVIPAGIEHAQRMREQGEDCCLHLPVPTRMPEELAQPIMLRASAEVLLHQQIVELARPAPPGELPAMVRDMMLRAVLGRILTLAREPMRDHDQVMKAQQLLVEHFRDVQSLSEVAHALHLSPDHLRHLFKRATGGSMMEYLTKVRMAHARQLLEHTSLPISEIATQCGYASHRRFGTVFRATFAHTARAYRQRHGGG